MMVRIWPDRNGPWWGLELTGMFVGLASLIKPIAVLHLVGYVVALLVRKSRSPRGRRKDVGDLVVGFAAPWIFAVVAMQLSGTLDQGIEDFVFYAKALARDTPAAPNSPPFVIRWFTGNADPKGILPPPFGLDRLCHLVGRGDLADLGGGSVVLDRVVGEGPDLAPTAARGLDGRRLGPGRDARPVLATLLFASDAGGSRSRSGWGSSRPGNPGESGPAPGWSGALASRSCRWRSSP